ncbi:MAG: restriction endonuclease subunit S [Candidatus Methylomirabilis sp.]|nr:restriction endonuclease subunit S [Deltaproteobacteria bacterium]
MQDKSPMTHLENICEIIMGQSPKGETYNTIGNGTPLLNGPTEFGEHHPKPVLYTTSPTRLCKKGDLLFCVRGSTTGRMNWADAEYCIGRGVGAFRAKSDEIDTRFIYYTLVCELPRLLSRCAGSVFPNLSRSDFETFDVVWPDRNIRSAIAHILGALDDKIELNRRMNEMLEAMARAIFKSWFVDFEPIPGFGPHKEWQDSPIGRIPKGWDIATLGDFSSLNPEVWSKETRPDVINYVDLSNTKWGRIETVTIYAKGEAPSRAQRVLRAQDTIVGTVRPGNGSYAFILEEGLTGSTGFAVLRPLKAEYAEIVYLTATAADNIERLAHLADGAAYPAVRPDVVVATQIVKPVDKVLRAFSHIVAPLLAKMFVNERESRTLGAIRDALLPKLLLGEIRVKNGEKFIVERT